MTNAVPCLDPETIAAYLDRRLDPAERAHVEEHLADCEECRTLLSETAAFLEADAAAKPAVVVPLARPVGPTRRSWLWSMAAAAAALLALTPLVLQRMRPTPESALAELDRALAGKRYVESRLSGFEYGEYVAPKRGPGDSDYPPAVLGAAGEVEALASDADTAGNLAALGSSQLAIGRADKAVENLEDAVRIAPKDARIHNDLAAAYLARFRAGGSPEDPAKAVEAAATAVALDPQLRAAVFNRALALEALPLRGEALRAWEAYLALDPSSGWANEARAHIEELKRPLPPPPPSPSAMLDELESLAFPAWGRAVLAARDAEARDALERARSLAVRIQGLDDDRLALDTLAAIDAASPERLDSLARAHVLVGDGRRAYLDGRFADADRGFAHAFQLLLDARSPYADWALLREATSRYQMGAIAHARERTQALEARTPSGYATLRARSRRLAALLDARAGALASSVIGYRAAQQAAAADPWGDDAIALQFLIAENYDLLGERHEAWKHFRQGLACVPHVRSVIQWHSRLVDTSIACLRQGRPRVARHLLNTLLTDSREPLSARAAAEGRLHRATVLSRIGESAASLEDLAVAEQVLEEAEERGGLPRLRAEWLATRGEVLSVLRPTEAVGPLSDALQFFRADSANWRLAALHLTRARAYARSGDEAAADRDLAGGLSVVEHLRSSLSANDLRVSFFALAAELLADRLSLGVRRGMGAIDAFRMVEQTRGRALREDVDPGSGPLELDAVCMRLPPRTVLITYALLEDRLLVWKLERSKWSYWSEDVSSRRLGELIGAASRAIRRPESGSGAAEQLYDMLVRRALASTDAETLVIVPDGCIHEVSFAALFDRLRGQFLVEQVALILTPSASSFVRSVTRSRADSSALVVSVPAADDTGEFPTLAYADGEGRAIAASYASAVLLSGTSATKEAFLRAAGKSSIVHFAGHARASRETPSLSRLLLAPASGIGGSGSLFAEEIGRASFPATRLVVLGACSTGAGPAYAAEGSLSLARPFLAAGVPAVVASLWDLDDRHTATLLVDFHRRIGSGRAPAQALRATQMAALVSPDESLRRPGAWASLVVFAAGLSDSATGG